ncbi:MAG: Gfo/Idh/MocA family oxidoreductase [Chloroflexi bacterium]|nr:Gfo/Idh/MocA family oxidoreductase [Chloroflexota bacterium]MCC6891574.1 Gfo/Idh/MocA family oxidoreductase [Anaerolineae bacterium]
MRIGILSFAHLHAENYMAVMQKMPDVEVVGIADENMERGQYFAKMFNVKLFDSYAALLAEKLDGVIVCSENSKHLPLVKLAAEAGVHVLCEKPLATTVADAQAIVDICKKAGVLLMTAFPMRFSTVALEIKKLIDSGKLGQIYGFNTTNQGALPEFHQGENLPFLKRDWFVDKALAGGGAITDHTVHLADMLRWYLQSEVVEVFATTNAIMHAAKVSVETGGLVMLTFANGVFASVDCSWSKPAYYPTWGGLTMELVAENGLATMDAAKQYTTVYSQKIGRPLWYGWGSDSNAGMLREFVDAVNGKRTPAVTGEDGVKAAEIVTAAYESAATDQPVKLT